MRIRFAAIAIAMLFATMSGTAQSIDPVTGRPVGSAEIPSVPPPSAIVLVRGEPLIDSLDSRDVVVSPDGSQIVYFDQPNRVCSAILLSVGGVSAPDCTFPVTGRLPSGNLLAPSPDGRYAVYHDDTVFQGLDGDLMLYDRDARIVRNLTDDDFDGGFMNLLGGGFPPGMTSLPIDSVPVWSHDSSQIYFVRTELMSDGSRPTGLYSIPVEGGTPRLLVSLGDEAAFSIFAGAYPVLDGAMSLSPSGRYLAAVRTYPNRTQNGISVIDLQTGIIQDVARASQFNPETDDAPILDLTGIDWLPDESGLLVAVLNPANFRSNVVQFTFADQTVTPLIDLSGLSEADFAAGGPESPSLLLPVHAGVLSDNSAIIWAGQGQGELRLWWAPLPLTAAPYTVEDRPTSVGASQIGSVSRFMSIGSAGDTVRAIFGGTLFTLLRSD